MALPGWLRPDILANNNWAGNAIHGPRALLPAPRQLPNPPELIQGNRSITTIPPAAGAIPLPGHPMAPLYISAVAPNVLVQHLPNNFTPTGNLLPAKLRQLQLLREFIGLDAAGNSPNLAVKVHAFGITRLTLTLPRTKFNGLVMDLSNGPMAAGGPISTNPERIAAALMCIMANTFDPRRPMIQSHLYQDNAEPHPDINRPGEINIPGPYWNGPPPAGTEIDGMPINPAQTRVEFLDHNQRYPGYTRPGHPDQLDPPPGALAALINNPTFLRGYHLIGKLLAPQRPPPPIAPMGVITRGMAAAAAAAAAGMPPPTIHPLAPIYPGADLYAALYQSFSINRPRQTVIVGGIPRVTQNFIPLRQNTPDYLKHLFRAVLQSIQYVRDAASDGPNQYATIGRIVMFFADLTHDGPNHLAEDRDGYARPLRWVGCNDKSWDLKEKLGGRLLISPRSSSNQHNCLFACLRYGRKIFLKNNLHVVGDGQDFFQRNDEMYQAVVEGVRVENRVMRQLLGLDSTQPINFASQPLMDRVGSLLKTSFTMVDAITGEEIRKVSVPGSLVEVQLMFFAPSIDSAVGHVKYVGGVLIPKQTCAGCGKVFTVKHSCEEKRRSYVKYQKAFQPPTDMFDVHRPDGILVDLKYSINYDEQVIYFDFETYRQKDDYEFQDGEGDDKHIVYSVGYWDGSINILHGETCLDVFLERLQELPAETVRYSDKKSKLQPIYLVAWNGARYDFKILLNHIITSPLWSRCVSCKDVVLNNNKLMRFTFTFDELDKEFTVFDPVLWIGSSLSAACEAYKINSDDAKGVFPHKHMVNAASLEDHLSLAELNDFTKYFQNDRKKVRQDPWTETKLVKLGIHPSEEGRYALKKIHDYYLRNDVISMKQICSMFFTSLDLLFNAVSFKYLTISQFTFAQFARHAKHIGQIFNPNDNCEYDFFKAAVYGGRVYPVQHYYESPQIDLAQLLGPNWQKETFGNGDIIPNNSGITFESLQEYAYERDVTSLYPWAMSENNYPVGRHVLLTQEKIAHINLFLKDRRGQRTALQPMIVHVKYVPNPCLNHPVLPRRKAGNEAGLVWDLMPSEGVYTSVELEMACMTWYELEIISGYEWPNTANIFKDHITKTFEIKAQGESEGNAVKRSIGKLMSNSTFGKLLQTSLNTTVKIVRTKAELLAAARDYTIEDIIFVNDGTVLLKCSRLETAYSRPYHLGAFVLSWARWRMFQNQVLLQPETLLPPEAFTTEMLRRSLQSTYKYTDTDCMYLENGHNTLIEGDNLGELKDESQGSGSGKIVFAIFLGKKQYMYICMTKKNTLKIVMRCKGISEPFLLFSDYVAARYDRCYSRLTVNEEAIKSHGVSNFFSVTSTTTSRTFNKTPFSSRLPIDLETLTLKPYSCHTIPHGHVLDTFKHGEYWWNKYQDSEDFELDGFTWATRKNAEKEADAAEHFRLRRKRALETHDRNIIDAGELESAMLDEEDYNGQQQQEDLEEEETGYIKVNRRRNMAAASTYLDCEAEEDD
jgi:hypothetical protein